MTVAATPPTSDLQVALAALTRAERLLDGPLTIAARHALRQHLTVVRGFVSTHEREHAKETTNG